jgi:hypothetical protein
MLCYVWFPGFVFLLGYTLTTDRLKDNLRGVSGARTEYVGFIYRGIVFPRATE